LINNGKIMMTYWLSNAKYQKQEQHGEELEINSKKPIANPKVLVTFYKAIIQSVLLYGSESWTISKRIINK
jgi:hypothetical protein